LSPLFFFAITLQPFFPRILDKVFGVFDVGVYLNGGLLGSPLVCRLPALILIFSGFAHRTTFAVEFASGRSLFSKSPLCADLGRALGFLDVVSFRRCRSPLPANFVLIPSTFVGFFLRANPENEGRALIFYFSV